jgi:hypothetical protein
MRASNNRHGAENATVLIWSFASDEVTATKLEAGLLRAKSP